MKWNFIGRKKADIILEIERRNLQQLEEQQKSKEYNGIDLYIQCS